MVPDANPAVLPAVTMTDELAKSIQNAVSAMDIRALLVDAAQKEAATSAQLATDQAAAQQAAADKIVADKAAEAAAIAAQGFKRTVSIGGQSFTFEGASEAELDGLELNALKEAYAIRPTEPAAGVAAVDPVAAAAAQKAADEAELYAKAEIERQYKSGEITIGDYIQKSGALNQYLESQGVSIAALRETTESKKINSAAQEWRQASEIFRDSTAGEDWPGGERNQELIGLKIQAMGLLDAEDKVHALELAYADMKRSSTVFPGDPMPAAPVTTADIDAAVARALAARTALTPAEQAAATAAAQVEAARVAAAAKVAAISSTFFGASSGVGGGVIAPPAAPAAAAAAALVPATATPQEIMDAWKAGIQANGQNPDDVLRATHQGRALRS